jgi:hypothetical protein
MCALATAQASLGAWSCWVYLLRVFKKKMYGLFIGNVVCFLLTAGWLVFAFLVDPRGVMPAVPVGDGFFSVVSSEVAIRIGKGAGS